MTEPSEQINSSPTNPALTVPNILTYGRILVVPIIFACFFWSSHFSRWLAFWLFIAAAITDYFDGYLARSFNQQSSLGRMLDPIADKLLVAVCLLGLTFDQTLRGWHMWAAVIILSREILVSGLREYLSEIKVSVPVTWLAKWKTTLQLIALAFLIVGPAADWLTGDLTHVGILLLWIAALLTLYTGYDYFKAGFKHLLKN